MAFDGGFTSNIAKELQCIIDCHIDKLYQPSADELVFLLRKKGFTKRLLISARQGSARVHFTNYSPENPAKPPMFCMLCRKHFSSARIISVEQKGFERVIEITFSTTNELGDVVNPKIICELIGNKSNIVLLNGEGKILDALRRSDILRDDRILQPGAVYCYPEAQEKLNILNADTKEIADKILRNTESLVSKALLETVGGVSPLVSREIAFSLSNDTEIKVENCDFTKFLNELQKLKDLFLNGKPYLILDYDKTPQDFSFMPINQYGDKYVLKQYETFSELLDAFYYERENAFRLKKLSGDVTRLTINLLNRANKRLEGRKLELKQTENREILRKYGELIKANIYAISSGDKSATVTDFYDENLSDITIPLDQKLSPAANASKYFKDYKKSCTAVTTLSALIQKDLEEIDYLESVLDSISRVSTSSEIGEITEELKNEGYIRDKQGVKSKKPTLKFEEYVSAEGYKIAVGKNNLQNDLLTTKIASKLDLWFHTKDIHGSHVIVFSGGKEVSEETLLFAAYLAAKNSKARYSSKVPVDYTLVKHVKKPSGAKAGMVIYTDNKTIFVNPTEEVTL